MLKYTSYLHYVLSAKLFTLPYLCSTLKISFSVGWGGGGMNWEIGIDIYTLICIKQITNKKNKLKKDQFLSK